MEFPKADPLKAAETVQKIAAWVGPMARSFKRTNETASRFAGWQEHQILHFIRQVELYAGDLETSYRSKRIDLLAQALRNLMELDVWAEYCDRSEADAKQFFDDAARDVSEVLEIHQKLHIQFTNKPYEKPSELNRNLKEHADILGVTDLGERFTQVRDAAKELGRSLRHDDECPQSLFDQFYAGGATLCYTCLARIEKTILKRYPEFYVEDELRVVFPD